MLTSSLGCRATSRRVSLFSVLTTPRMVAVLDRFYALLLLPAEDIALVEYALSNCEMYTSIRCWRSGWGRSPVKANGSLVGEVSRYFLN